MSEYVRVHRKKWNSRTYRSLSEDAQRLFDYLTECPHGNMLGLFVLRPGYAMDDLQWTGADNSERFHKSFQELLDKETSNGHRGLIQYDPDTSLVWIRNFLEHNPLINPNCVTAAIKKLENLPSSSILFDSLKSLIESFDKPFHKPLTEELAKRIPKLQYTVTVTETVDTSSSLRSEEAAFSLPDNEEINEGSGTKIQDDLTQVCEQLKPTWPKVFQFKNKMLKEGKNPRAVLHVLCRAYMKQDFKKEEGGPWAYCSKILNVEDGNYNEREHGKTS